MFCSKILFAKLSSKFWRYFGKVLGELLEKFEKIFLKFCKKFTKMWRFLKKYLEDLLEIDTELIIPTFLKIFNN